MALSRRAFLKTGLADVTLLACSAHSTPGPQPAAAATIPWTTLEKTVVAVPVPATSPRLPPYSHRPIRPMRLRPLAIDGTPLPATPATAAV